MEAFLYGLGSSGGLAVLAGEHEETSGRVTLHVRVQTSTIQTPHVRVQVLLVQICDVLVLPLAHDDQVAFSTEVALHIEFCLQEVQDVLGLTSDRSCNRLKVYPRGLGASQEASSWVFTLLILLLFIIALLVLLVHNEFDAFKHELVLVVLVPFYIVQVELLYNDASFCANNLQA